MPGTSVTIDVFNFVNALIKLLLPALGLPIIVTINPSLIKEANFAEFTASLIFFCIFFNLFKIDQIILQEYLHQKNQ